MILVLFLTAFFFVPSTVLAEEDGFREIPAGHISRDTTWRGNLTVTGAVVVAEGSVLTISAGSRIAFRGEEASLTVAGSISVEGEETHPVIFLPEKDEPSSRLWGGVLVTGSPGENRFAFIEISRAKSALTVLDSKVTMVGAVFLNNDKALALGKGTVAEMERLSFVENGVGVEAAQDSRLVLAGSSFEKNRQGVVVSSGASGNIRGNRFHGGKGVIFSQGGDLVLTANLFLGNEVGLIAERAGKNVQVIANRFENGDIGIKCPGFCSFQVLCTEFANLKTGVMIQNFSEPLFSGNLFSKNDLAAAMGRKSQGVVSLNRFEGNEQAVFLDLSSYPMIERNAFTGNGKSVVLGKFMSADWEERVGSTGISMENARRSSSRRLGEVGKSRTYSGEVDARHNWWGAETTAEMERLGEGGNVSSIEDFYDRNEVTYRGYKGSFRIDRVLYAPWEKKIIEEAGPDSKSCSDLKASAEMGGND